MSLSAKQYRQYKLIVLLSTGKPVSKDALFQEMDCSEPTFIRDMREIRKEFQAEIKFHKASGKYQMTEAGVITPKLVRYMREAITVRDQTVSSPTGQTVVLDKEGKKPVSLSLRFSVIRKIETYGYRNGMNRSQVVEWLVESYLSNKKK